MHFGKVEPGRFSRARRGAAAVAFVSVLGLGGCSQEPRPAAGEATGTSAQPLSRAFAAGSLVIPMDTTYQDLGTLKAFGLV